MAARTVVLSRRLANVPAHLPAPQRSSRPPHVLQRRFRSRPAPRAPRRGGQARQPGPPIRDAHVYGALGDAIRTVRPERVADFEKVLAYLQAAFEKSTDRTRSCAGRRLASVQSDGSGERVGGLRLPVRSTVVGADYGIGKILADAYPEQAEQIWKLYRDSCQVAAAC